MDSSFDQMWDKVGHDLGWFDHNMSRDRPYNGQPHTSTGVRGSTEVKGITFRDLRDCFIRAYILSHNHHRDNGLNRAEPNATLRDEANKGERAALCEDDVYKLKGNVDPIAIAQNLCCEVEKIMGIFPNVPRFEHSDD